jgi:ketosteroid isomerase-like protein
MLIQIAPVRLQSKDAQMSESDQIEIPTMNRRIALAAIAALPLTSRPVSAEDVVAALVQRAAAKNAAFMRGDMERWLELTPIDQAFTLMQPFGGPASHGFDSSPKRLEEMSRFFRNGTTDLEVVATYASEAMVVLVMIERQRAEVGALPEQDWSLRVTEVYRKAGSEWKLAHRHADPLVRRIPLGTTAALARGDA